MKTIIEQRPNSAASGSKEKRRPCIVPVPVFSDHRGRLGVVEGGSLPFFALRLYFLFDLPANTVRGEHAHKTLQQVMVCLSGSAEVLIWDGVREQTFELSSREIGLYVPEKCWRRILVKESGTIIAVLASQEFDKDDYLYTKEEFVQFIESQG